MLLRFLFLLLLSANSLADGFPLRVLDEGGQPVPTARVLIDDVAVDVDTGGRFSVPTVSQPTVRITVIADGYYSFVHTVSQEDLRLGLVDAMRLVERQPGRRLLLFAGDAMMTRRFLEPQYGEPRLVSTETLAADARRLLDPMRLYIGLADYASVNLETPLADGPPGEPLPKSVAFWSHTAFADALKEAGFDYVALGNNHSYDYRDAGVESTAAALAAAGLGYSGAGLDEASARAPFQADMHGEPFAFLSYVGWRGYFRPDQAAAGDKGGAALGTIDNFTADLAGIPPFMPAVLQHHTGLEYLDSPPESVRTQLRHAVDAGADVAIAHHPHVMQGLEVYRDRLIAYSMGNFLFDQYYPTTQLGLLLYVWMDGPRFHRAEIVPLHISGYVPTPATGSLRYAALHRLARQSAEFDTCFGSSGAHAVIGSTADCVPARLSLPADAGKVVALRELGLSPFRPYYAGALPGRYRLGTDILRRGAFDYAGLFDTVDRGWILGRADRIDASWQIRVLPGEQKVRVGMQHFQRAWTPSTPTTLAGRIRASGDANVTVYLQRRRTNDSTREARENGPLTRIGVIEGIGSQFTEFRFHFDQPRVGTREVRLLFDVEDRGRKGATVEIDALSWVEWRTSWLRAEQGSEAAVYATHIERE